MYGKVAPGPRAMGGAYLSDSQLRMMTNQNVVQTIYGGTRKPIIVLIVEDKARYEDKKRNAK
jgi:hypothetical protein